MGDGGRGMGYAERSRDGERKCGWTSRQRSSIPVVSSWLVLYVVLVPMLVSGAVCECV
jgi:hypothetical protein